MSILRPKRAAARIVVLVAAWLASFAAALWLILSASRPRPEWTALDGTPVPDGFLFLMYPAHESVPLLDAPDGSPVATLHRALGNTAAEIAAGEWIRVAASDGEQWVRKADPTYTTPSNAADSLRAYEAAQGKSFWGASVSTCAEPSGAETVTFTRRPDDDHVETFVYTVANGAATPLEMTRYFGPATAIDGLFRAGAAAAAGTLAVIAICLGWFLTGRT
ncbi:MAG: hypothetical protein KF745_12345 [Phycisphaeraceae bacterium]|nr:hypothetical protein [Phycisphaeraceae bacterium]